jgi:KaiC/GvpD/RAD55 family RecA-like ATPase
MTQDEIIEMAEQAGWDMGRDLSDGFGVRLEAFAKLVAAKEREIQGAALEKILESIRRSERAEEREACAKLCDEFESDTDPDAGAVLAAAIKARGQA